MGGELVDIHIGYHGVFSGSNRDEEESMHKFSDDAVYDYR